MALPRLLRRSAKSLINYVVRPLGMELAYSYLIHPPDEGSPFYVRPEVENNWLKNLNVRTVLDVGANTGQFASKIRRILPEAQIYSFEPLRDCYEELVRGMKDDPNFRAFDFALGEEESSAQIFRSEYSASSSLLRMAELHAATYPFTQNLTTEDVTIRKLDALTLNIEPNLLVKLDVQGYEDKVIAGGRGTVGQAACVIVEVSYERLYEEQPLFDDIYCLLTGMGFEYWGNWEQLRSPLDGRVLQADAVFVNPLEIS